MRVLRRLFEIDTRALALFRMALGALVLSDAIARAADLRLHYTADGVLPVALMRQLWPQLRLIAPHFWSDSLPWQAALLTVIALLAIALIAGWRTRATTCLLCLLLLSLRQRNYLILQSSDQIVHLLLLWSIFVPLSARWSLDARAGRVARADVSFSVAGAILLLQPAILYFFSAILKSGPDWRSDASAVENALSLARFAKEPAFWLLRFRPWLAAVTRTVWTVELIAPLLLFVPIATRRFRLASLVALTAMQAGFGSALALGNFPWAMTVAIMPLIPFGTPDGAALRSATRWWPMEAVAAALACVSLGSNFASAGLLAYPAPLRQGLRSAELWQNWTMFAPWPARMDGWLVVDGEFVDGTHADLFRGGAPQWTRPALVSSTYRNSHWRKYMELLPGADPRILERFAVAMAREWERCHPDTEVRSVRVVMMTDYVVPGVGPGDAQPEVLYAWKAVSASGP